MEVPTEKLAALEAQLLESQRLIMDLQERDALKTQFLSNISHDLHTPLTAIITHAEILRDGILGDVTPKQKESISTIITGGRPKQSSHAAARVSVTGGTTEQIAEPVTSDGVIPSE